MRVILFSEYFQKHHICLIYSAFSQIKIPNRMEEEKRKWKKGPSSPYFIARQISYLFNNSACSPHNHINLPRLEFSSLPEDWHIITNTCYAVICNLHRCCWAHRQSICSETWFVSHILPYLVSADLKHILESRWSCKYLCIIKPQTELKLVPLFSKSVHFWKLFTNWVWQVDVYRDWGDRGMLFVVQKSFERPRCTFQSP